MTDLHHEVHFAFTEADARTLELAGLPVTPELPLCEHCLSFIGEDAVTGQWVPFAVVLDTENHRRICMDCAAPLISNRS